MIRLFALFLMLAACPALASDTDLSEVKAHFNSLQNISLKDKEVVIFGCGHGPQNEHGVPGDEGDHTHDHATCVDNNPESKADFVMDVTKTVFEDDYSGMADVVYFEYLTPEVIYKPATFANALKLLAPEGILIWDVYWGLSRPGKPTAAQTLSTAQYEIKRQIEVLNTKDAFHGVFALSAEDKDLAKHFYCGDNPFNGRNNSTMFIIHRKDLDGQRVKQFVSLYQTGAIREVLLRLCEELVKPADKVDHDLLATLGAQLQKLAKWNPEAEKYEYLTHRARALAKRINELRDGKQSIAETYAWMYRALIEPNPL